MTDFNPDVADKNAEGDITAKNQDGQTEQEILDEAAERTIYDIQFKHSTTVEAYSEEAAYSMACGYWNMHRKRTADEMNIAIRPL